MKLKQLKEDREKLLEAFDRMQETRYELGQIVNRTDKIWDIMDQLNIELDSMKQVLRENSEKINKEEA